MIKIVDWNIAQREDAWHHLLHLDADIALLQEAAEPPVDIASKIEVDNAPWKTSGKGLDRPWRVSVVRLSDRVKVEWIDSKAIDEARRGDFAVSRLGTLAAAIVTPSAGSAFTVVSMYAPWEKPHISTGSGWIYADASAHRAISDLSSLIGQQTGHRLIAAGDLNILYGYGEHGSNYWEARYATVFDRMTALGLVFVGPQAPNGRVAKPWPEELPSNSKNVPTYHTNRQTSATATRQLDFVFASESIADQVSVEAINDPENWGSSDHCRLEIQIA